MKVYINPQLQKEQEGIAFLKHIFNKFYKNGKQLEEHELTKQIRREKDAGSKREMAGKAVCRTMTYIHKEIKEVFLKYKKTKKGRRKF